MSDASESAIFLSFGGVTGETILDGGGVAPGPGSNWIQLQRCEFDARINVMGRAKGGGSSSVDFGGDAPPITIVKRTDKATVGLMREMLGRSSLASAAITFVRTADNEGPAEYMRYNLDSCSIIEFDFLSTGYNRADETFKILYKQLTMIGYGGTHGAKGAQSTAVIRNGG